MTDVKLEDVQAAAPIAATAPADEVKQVEVGRIISQAFSTYMGNFISFSLVGFLALLPFALMEFWVFGGFGPTDVLVGMPEWVFFLLYMGVIMLLNMVATAAIIVGTAEHQAGRKAGYGIIFSKSLGCLPAVLVASFLVTLMTLVGYVFLIIPGVIIGLALSVTIPAIVVEGRGPLDAIKRSFELTSGNRGSIFGLMIVVNIITTVFSVVLELMIGALIGDANTTVGGALVSLVGLGVVAAITGAVFATLYTQLRIAKEGTSIDEIASVFA